MMIATPTTLVLGAGASMPYGFPSGYELRKRLCNPNNLAWLHEEGLFSAAEISYFCDAFLHSSIESIDAFLAKRGAHCPPDSVRTFEEIGKAAIALVLLSCEDARKLVDVNNDDHWYSYLWQIIGTSVEEFESSNLSIVTFNYDRSLECYLLIALKNSFGLSDERAAEALAKIRIVHVYGKLGALPGESSRGHSRPYNPKVSPQAVATAANGLKVIAESRDDDQVFDTAHEYLYSANRICFLGFGFDPINVKRLKIVEILRDRFERNEFRGPLTYATTCGLAKAERKKVEKLLMPEVSNIGSYMHHAQINYEQVRHTIYEAISEHPNEKNRSYLRHAGVFY